MTTTVMRYSVTSHDVTVDGPSTITVRHGRRYSQGWRSAEQDRKPAPNVARIISQDYSVIKRECLAQKALWEDPNFPATDQSIYPSSHGPLPFKWTRASELCEDARMFVDGFTRFDVVQGELGNCWFLAATASLCATRDTHLFKHVIPDDNLFVKDYAGVFHFQIWQYGKWVDVVVDDRLPTMHGRLVFVHSPTHNEFWPALLEKAYAKLNGSYEALQGGCAAEAMEDFTGGVTETIDLQKDVPRDLFTVMCKAFERKSLMGCSIDTSPGQFIEGVLPNGLILGHAYSVTSVKQLNVQGKNINLVRIRNPWGNEYEWKGAWSDKSAQWQSLSEEQKKFIGQADKEDGEFWMSYDDFLSNFTKLEMCMMTPVCETISRDDAWQLKHKWKLTVHDGSWQRQVNAGGCRNYLETFWTNPQYCVEIVDFDEGDDDKTGTLIIALMQKERRKKKREGQDLLTIGYSVYKTKSKTTSPLDKNFFKYNSSVSRSTFSNSREVVGRHKLAPGYYVVVPSTFKPNEDGDFILRIFSEQQVPAEEMDEATSLIEDSTAKVKGDIDVLQPSTSDAEVAEVAGQVEADAEVKRKKAMAVSESDRDEERELRTLFRKTAGEDLEVDPYELRAILDSNFKHEFKFDGVSLETARSMVAMMDIDHSGKLGYDEFKKLWTDLRHWKKVFREYDQQHTSTLDSFELRSALTSAGFLVSNSTFKCLVMRYSDQRGQVFFDDFILCAVRLKTMFDTFKTAAESQTQATFNLDQFIQTTMYS